MAYCAVPQDEFGTVIAIRQKSERDSKALLIARRHPTGIGMDHPASGRTRRIMSRIGLQACIAPSASKIAAMIYRRLPSVSIGITKPTHTDEVNKTVFSEPIASGATQLLGIQLATDGGYCVE